MLRCWAFFEIKTNFKTCKCILYCTCIIKSDKYSIYDQWTQGWERMLVKLDNFLLFIFHPILSFLFPLSKSSKMRTCKCTGHGEDTLCLSPATFHFIYTQHQLLLTIMHCHKRHRPAVKKRACTYYVKPNLSKASSSFVSHFLLLRQALQLLRLLHPSNCTWF